jgi:putative acyl-CoA dehydrogenase
MAATHEVLNQATPLEGFNPFDADQVMVEAVRREGADWAEDRIRTFAEICGRAETIKLGYDANEKPPKLRTHDRFGHRIDEVEFDSSWHRLMSLGVENGLHSLPWREPGPGANVARAALFMLLTHVEAGVGCPLSMTYSVVPALRRQPELAAEWEPKITALGYDGRLRPVNEKPGAIFGMAMTEKQGGSDVRANTTRAEALNGGGPGAEYSLIGHKWFCSAPMSDGFLVLAQAPGGLSCFLVPRFTPDGERNVFRIQRLKDKLGNRSNASSEIEFDGTWGRMVGEEGRGVATIIEMVNRTRLDCVIGGTASLRAGVAHATHHAAHRSAFGKLLIDQPLMQNVLADLCIESEAATIAAMRLCRAYDDADAESGGSEGSGQAALFRRLATPVLKYWICKRAPSHAVEALECFGGNGYVEESGMPRLFRESPLCSIWEGSGNVQCLDVLRAMVKTPESVEAFFIEVEQTGANGSSSGAEAALAAATEDLKAELSSDLTTLESRARRVVEKMALVLQGSLLIRHGDPAVADAFCATRLGGNWGYAFGTLPAGTDCARIIDRHRPKP